MQQSEVLTAFYRAYLDWVAAGAPDYNEHGFSRCVGLCSNLDAYCAEMEDAGYHGAEDEMEQQFRDAGLNTSFPFESPREYSEAQDTGRMHLNQYRLSWVREKVR